jgi:DUF4097 and DUF4098 domain-containing protein YvlB
MNPKSSQRFTAMALVLALAPLSLFGQKEMSKSFTGIKKIRMTTASGNCLIKKSADASVTVDLKYTYDDDYEPSMIQEGDRLVIKERFHGRSSRGTADWKLTVPDNLDIQFTTGSGDVEVAGLALELEATTGSGKLVFTSLSGEVEGTTGSGDVELENVRGAIRATSGSGHFRVAKSTGELTLTSGSGDLRLTESKATFRVTTGSGNITGGTISVDGSSSFTTGSGDAEVTLAATPQHDLSLTSGSGDAVLNFNGNEIKGEIVMKASKKHGNINAPFAFDKTEEINQGEDNVTVRKTVVKGSATPHISVSTGSGDATLKK